MFYVYMWFIKDTNEVFYIGKGCRRCYETSRRNEIFKEIYNQNDCDVKIIKYFEDEQDALDYEHQLILEYRKLGQAQANIDDGGKGGLSFIWTDKMREYKSKYNPMKDLRQRQRMSDENPMKNPEIAKRVGMKHRKAVIIDGQEYSCAQEAANVYNVSKETITHWCKIGCNSKKQICYYKNQEPLDKNIDFNIAKPHIGSHSVYVDDIYYPSIMEAAKANHFSYSRFSSALKEGRTTYKNHSCRYADQQPSQENS